MACDDTLSSRLYDWRRSLCIHPIRQRSRGSGASEGLSAVKAGASGECPSGSAAAASTLGLSRCGGFGCGPGFASFGRIIRRSFCIWCYHSPTSRAPYITVRRLVMLLNRRRRQPQPRLSLPSPASSATPGHPRLVRRRCRSRYCHRRLRWGVSPVLHLHQPTGTTFVARECA
jgi:hypothetical protein